MVAYVSDEISIFIWSVVTGIVIMIGYDIFCAATDREKYSIVVCNILDGVFVTCSCAVMIFVLLAVSNGYVRSYEFAGAFIGGFLYKITISTFLKSFFRKITEILFCVFNFFLKILLTPIRFMYKIMYNTISVFYRFVQKLLSPATRGCSRFFSLIRTSLKKT